MGILTAGALISSALAAEPYQIVNTSQTLGTGGIGYVYADNHSRRLYVPRGSQILVFDLDTLAPAGVITNSGGNGVVVDPASHHGFSSSSPVTMFDSLTLETINTLQVESRPSSIFFEPATERVFVFSHEAPNVTVIDPKDGSTIGTIDLGGAPGQAASDHQGHVYVALEDKAQIAVVDANLLKCTAHFSLGGKGGAPAGLGLDAQNRVLFAMCRHPATCVVLGADDGKILAALPIGNGTDGGGFNPATMEAFSSQLDGTLTIIKESSPTSFEWEQTVTTKPLAKACALDTKNNRIVLIAIEPVPVSVDAEETASASATPPAGGDDTQGGLRRGRDPRFVHGGPGLLDIVVVGKQAPNQ